MGRVVGKDAALVPTFDECWSEYRLQAYYPLVAAVLTSGLGDFVTEKTPQRVAMLAAVGAWLYFTEGNLLFAGLAYWLYKRTQTVATGGGQPAAAAAAAAAGGGAATAPQAQRVD